jgi:hypothetical protein
MDNVQKHNNFLIILLEYYYSFFIFTLMATVWTEARMFWILGYIRNVTTNIKRNKRYNKSATIMPMYHLRTSETQVHGLYLKMDNVQSRESLVGMPTGNRLDSWGLIPGRSKIFLFSIVSRPATGPTQPPIQWVPGALFPRVKWQGHEADHSLPSSAKDKNDGAIPLVLNVFMAWRSIN